jgi:geranylgeranyl reductase family protein
MSLDAEIAVVGAGPAGAFAAYLLARAGARVTIFDPSHPREKPCGGGVTGRALALVAPALGLARFPAVPVATSRFDVTSDHSASVPLHDHGFSADSSLLVVSRAAFDRALLDGAIGAGAVFRPERATHVEVSPTGAQVRTATGTFTADFLLGADGANSFVRRRLSTQFTRSQLSIATGVFAHGLSSSEILVRFVPKPQGYIWSFPRTDHLAIGIGAQADDTQSAPLREILGQWLTETKIAEGARLEWYSWPIPSLRVEDFAHERPAQGRWMLLGDAGGLVDPLTREGIFFALRSAQIAVDALTRTNAGAGAGANRSRGGPLDPASYYSARIAEEIFPELQMAARLKRGFFRGPFTRLLIDALHRSAAVRGLMCDLVGGHQPYHTLKRRLLGTFEFGLAWQLLRLQMSRAS